MTDYGTDIAMTADATDIDPAFGLVSGRRCLAEAVARRYQTPLGRLLDDPDYGFDLAGEIHDDLGPADVGRISSQAAAESDKDQRVVSTEAEATFLRGVLTLAAVINDGQGPFSLVLGVSGVTVSLLQVR